jgi:hypothetical protein
MNHRVLSGPMPLWYHSSITRENVEKKLKKKPDGTFIIRDSGSSHVSETLNCRWFPCITVSLSSTSPLPGSHGLSSDASSLPAEHSTRRHSHHSCAPTVRVTCTRTSMSNDMPTHAPTHPPTHPHTHTPTRPLARATTRLIKPFAKYTCVSNQEHACPRARPPHTRGTL